MSYHIISGFTGQKNIGSEVRSKGPDTIFIHKSISGWNLIVDINEERKLTMSATKNIGKIGSGWNDGDQASLKIQLQTINYRVEDFVKTNENYNQVTASSKEKGYIELDNKLGIVTESFKPELEFYERKFAGSSILEIEEFLLSLVPNFKSLLEDDKLDQYIGNIINEAADVQPKHKKDYTKPKHSQVSKPTETISIQEHNKLKKELEQEKASVQALTDVNQSLAEKLKTETENKTGLNQ